MHTYNKTPTINFPTRYGHFLLTTYETTYFDQPEMKYVVVIQTKILSDIPTIRIQSSCMFSEVFTSQRCDCREQLEKSMATIHKTGGILFYLDQEGRGHGLFNKTKELHFQQSKHLDTVDASKELDLKIDSRKFDVVIDILKEMNIEKVKLITNNPAKMQALLDGGIKIVKRIPLYIKPNQYNRKYLLTKKVRLGHILDDDILRA